MEPSTHLSHLRVDAPALLDAYRSDPSAAVPSCPGWDRAALLAHVTSVHTWVRAQLEVGTGERVRRSDTELPPEGDELAGVYEAGVADLLVRLEAMDVAATWPTWAGPQPGTFFPRRMAQETAMHRWDADPSPIAADLAFDGVDEFLELFAPRIPGEGLGGADGTIHLHATDLASAAGEWLIRLTGRGIEFEHGHAKGDVAVRGGASDLLLWAWNRVPVDDRFEVFGDPALLQTWRQVVVI